MSWKYKINGKEKLKQFAIYLITTNNSPITSEGILNEIMDCGLDSNFRLSRDRVGRTLASDPRFIKIRPRRGHKAIWDLKETN